MFKFTIISSTLKKRVPSISILYTMCHPLGNCWAAEIFVKALQSSTFNVFLGAEGFLII